MSTADVQTEPAVAALLAAGWVRETEQAAPTAWADAAPAVLRAFRGLRSSDDAVWFLPAAGSAFAWDEFRARSLDAAVTDADRASVARFWAAHTPFLHAVRDGYAYLAVRVDGAVVFGAEPEFEDAVVVAESIDAFLLSVADGALPPPVAGLLR